MTADPQDLPKLLESLKNLAKTELSSQNFIEEKTGEAMLSGVSEFQLSICMEHLEKNFCQDFKIFQTDPVFTYKETITIPSTRVCLAKSPNKHNRLYFNAEPLAEGLSEEIERGIVNEKSDPKERAKYLSQNFDYDLSDMRKIWCFGPNMSGPNILVDMTKGVQYLNEIKDHCISGFQWSTKEGILCEEEMRGIRFNMVDVVHYSDAIHRGGGQIIPTMRRVLYACQLSSNPSLQESYYFVEINAPQDSIGAVYSVLNKRRGIVKEENQILNSTLYVIKAYMPVSESLEFTSDLRFSTGGNAFAQCFF